ncbi:hypothetical protein [Streptomyces sp. ISL-11]|uniref:hypothetical protein n=1 Tax=Streptomyces sp. ISL-11 TaxID=2819174 RepID=UPI001BED2A18|nr:hypothetical protein [Streptomyces sp. ISL-11]MBT2384268.1 hypothetical protein [Streptomyces sp. ISL-11]
MSGIAAQMVTLLCKEALMLAQETRLVATPTEASTIGALMVQPEATVSDPPLPSPEAAGLLLLLLSPKEPKEPKGR